MIVLGASLVFSASAQATITFTSVAPASPAVAGQAFEVSATSSTGAPVTLTLTVRPADDPVLSDEAAEDHLGCWKKRATTLRNRGPQHIPPRRLSIS